MALPATTIIEVQIGASDTLNGGGFDSASTGKSTDLTATNANTSAPVVASASYNFVAGDVGHWLYVQAGTNWIPGWYQIASVASNQATLNAAIGAAVQYLGVFGTAESAQVPSTMVGCASVASPTVGTWAVDYSQVTSVAFALTGLTTAAANAIILTASATVAMVGNLLIIKAGTNFTAGTYAIIAASAGVSLTVDRNCTSAAGVAGTCGIGGALATPGKAGQIHVASSQTWAKYNATPFNVANASTNTAGNAFSAVSASAPAQRTRFSGYYQVRGDRTANKPTLKTSASSNSVIAITSGGLLENVIIDGDRANRTTVNGVLLNGGTDAEIRDCTIKSCTNSAVNVGSGGVSIRNCYITDCATVAAIKMLSGSTIVISDSMIYDHQIDGISMTSSSSLTVINTVLAKFASGKHAILSVTAAPTLVLLRSCTIQTGSGADGLNIAVAAAGYRWRIEDCIFYGNGGYGINGSLANSGFALILNKCAFGNNTSGAYPVNTAYRSENEIALSADPFVSASTGNFALNNTIGGAACRAAGIPDAFPGGLTTGYPDIGAVQHADPPAGGASYVEG